MKLKKVFAVAVLFIMIFSALSSGLTAYAGSSSGDTYKNEREVYLHARSHNPTGYAASSTVVKNDPFNLYFSIDNPNKGDYNSDVNDADVKAAVDAAVALKKAELTPQAEADADAAGLTGAEKEKFIEDYLAPKLLAEANRVEQIERHTQPYHDLNGYTLRIYYDGNYFKLKDGIDVNAPFDYTVPDKTINNNGQENISQYIGYSARYQNARYDSEKGLNYAEIQVFFYGTFLPQEESDPTGTKWYDLCALPLIPLKTGTTRVSIELDGDDNKSSLVLFSKHEQNESFVKKFAVSAVNGGNHTINIVDSVRPVAPSASPLPIDYIKGDKVKLICKDGGCTTDNEAHDIYFRINGASPYQKYEGQEFTFDKTTDIQCYSVKKTDTLQENTSSVVSFRYEILPEKPILFAKTDGAPISNVYNADDKFTVYCDIEEVYDGILDADTNIYYTFSDILHEEFTDSVGKFKTDGVNPYEEWVKVEKAAGLSVPIEKTVKMKLITVRENSSFGQEISDVATYLLGIKPGDVTASPVPGTNPGKVSLNAEDGCEIYYTTDGSDPVSNGIKYSGEIPIDKDTVVRAVAKKDGIYGDVTDFSYTVTNKTGNIISSNYPSGEYESGINVYLTSDDSADKILYSIDGGISWNEYKGKLNIDKNTVIKAKADGTDEIFEFSYVIKPHAPVFVPTSTYFGQVDFVSIYCFETMNNILEKTNKADYTLYYTTDGSDPRTNTNAFDTASSPVNTAVVEVDDYIVIKAAVKSKDGQWSDVVTNTYDVVYQKLAPPIPTLEPGHYTADKMLTEFFREQDGTDIYYTISYGDTFVKDPISRDELPSRLYSPGTPIELSGRMVIKAFTVNKSLNLKSDVAVFEYVVSPKTTPLKSPYADKESGIYEESANGDKFLVKLYSENSGDVIKYKLNDGEWKIYDSSVPVEIEDDSVLYIKANDGEAVSYTYEFIPKMPVATLPSGRYSSDTTEKVQIKLPDGYAYGNYYLFYRDNKTGEDVMCPSSATGEFEIDESVSYKAYVVKVDSEGNIIKRSKNAVFYYIVEPDSMLSGDVYTLSPYKVSPNGTKYISTHILSKEGYNEGIKLATRTAGAKIKYSYIYNGVNGNTGGINPQYYDNSNPIMVTSSMKDITVYASLTDSEGNEIVGSDCVFYYKFVNLKVPQFSFSDFTIINDYPGDKNYLIYYTLDGSSDPSDPKSGRILYDGGKITLSGDATIKTVYYKACGECSACASDKPLMCGNYVYGDIGIFNYKAPIYIPSGSGSSGGSSGGGGGGSYNRRQYTKDIFGNEHVTHISYIKGYPDGSVKADGNITREEVTAILYRIKDKTYDKPFTSTGSVFPDVEASRWSVTEIEYMANEDVVLGYPDGEFKPSKNLTRAEFAALIYRFVNLRKVDAENKFSDLSEDHWAYKEIIALMNKGLMQGYEDGTFRPENDITRAEVITVINKILGRNPLPSYVKSLDFNPFNDLEAEKWYYVDVLEATITHDYFLNGKGFEYEWENWK